MSRLPSILRPLAICITFTALTACGGGGDGSSAVTPATANASTAPPPAAPVPAPTQSASTSTEPAASLSPATAQPPALDPLPPVDETPPEGPATGSAQLSWLAPEANADGTALNPLAGYRIRYGRAAGALDKTIEIENPAVLSYTVENLTPGAWYFEVVAVNDADIEGPPSNTGSKTII